MYHGHTLTSQIYFEDVIKTINEFAFASNPYPVILSLELHCDYDQQEVMADIMAKVFGDKLYILPPDFKDFQKYPSPDDLKYKILCKSSGKIEDSAQYLYQQTMEAILDEEDDDEDEDTDLHEPEIKLVPVTQPVQARHNAGLKKITEESKEQVQKFQKVEVEEIPFKRAP